jgi:flagellar basal body-associated protein FliL
MSDEAPEVKKKKGKLPIILILALVIGGGGFFMMKSKGGKPKEPELKLGAIEQLPEFLVNLKGGSTYLQTEIAFHLKDGFKKEELDKGMPAVRDAILTTLSGKGLNEVSSEKAKIKLKREIAAAVNKVLLELNASAEEKHKKKKKGESDEPPEEPEYPDWDSDTGPVLKVYFTKFATQ